MNSPSHYPIVSIIIAVRNEKAALLDTLNNLAQQSYPNLEVIVIDGQSSDGSCSILENPPCAIHRWVSEPDQGIADAFNKGIKLAKGEFINFQGAGDTLVAPNTLTELFEAIPSNTSLLCGRVQRVAEDGKTPLWQAPKRWVKPFKKTSLLFKMALPHQALFTHRSFFDRYGLFDLQCKFAMDYELLLRAYHDFPSVHVKNTLVANWRAGGIGTARTFEIYDEYDRIKRQHQVAPAWALHCIDQWNRLKYRCKSALTT